MGLFRVKGTCLEGLVLLRLNICFWEGSRADKVALPKSQTLNPKAIFVGEIRSSQASPGHELPCMSLHGCFQKLVFRVLGGGFL